MQITIVGTLRRYHLGRKISQGGYGEVFLAAPETPEFPGESFAIKIAKPRLSKKHGLQLLKEAALRIHLDHPNIVKMLDFGKYEDRPFLAMEYVDGWTQQAIIA